jgi:pimeloyl-ACP methyl ester carboxylesterase
MRWYRNVLENCAFEEERASQLDPVVKLPALIVLANRDAFGIPALQEKTTTACIPDLRVKSVDAGHWLMLEKEDEVNKYLQDFFEEIEGKVLR